MITSATNAKLKLANRLLQDRSARARIGCAVVESEKLIRELMGRCPDQIRYILTDSDGDRLSDIHTIWVKPGLIKKISSVKSPSPYMAVVNIPPKLDGDAAGTTSLKKIVVLDRLSRPENVGAIIRNAAAFGIEAVFLTHGTADPFHPDAIRASAGMSFWVPLGSFDAVKSEMDRWRWWRMDPRGSDMAEKIAPPYAIVLGSEGQGVTCKAILAVAHGSVRIAHHPVVESLNVAVASGILFSQLAMYYK